ncbi:MAG TPA: penicillin-binding protein activator [Gammaproteobacteria bacterium]
MTLFNRTLVSTLILFLTACAITPTDKKDIAIPPGVVGPIPETGVPPEDPKKFVALAQQTISPERDRHLARAAELFINRGMFEDAQQQLQQISVEFADADTLLRTQILHARIALGTGHPRQALQLLNFTQILPTQLQIIVAEIRASAFLNAGYPLEAAKTRVQIDNLIIDEARKTRNHQAIWEALSLLPTTSLNQLSEAPLHTELLGWIDLAKIAKQGQIDWQHLQEGIINWRQRYPKHPAAKFFTEQLGQKQIELLEQPSHIAVLLPFTGQYQQGAAAIRDGIMAAYYLHPDKTYRPKITFIDTGENPLAAWNHYRKATEMGADFVIGPFVKAAVSSLAQASQLEVPTLTLNYAQDQLNITENLFQFGLLPEDEARQVAEMAYRQGRSHAAVLVPEGEWGQRLLIAFQQRFEELGGNVINHRAYLPGKHDFKAPIQNLLNIHYSHARHRKVQRLLNTDLKFTPYRRQDVDMIFIAATPNDARQLKTQFKFHYAGELPVYATSHAFTGNINTQADRDIDELYYCDMPWILNPPGPLKQSLEKYWPEQENYTRFFALGTDAYNILPFIARLKAKSYERFSGQTGNLYLGPFNRLHRELLWAQFDNGRPQLIDINKLPENIALEKVDGSTEQIR